MSVSGAPNTLAKSYPTQSTSMPPKAMEIQPPYSPGIAPQTMGVPSPVSVTPSTIPPYSADPVTPSAPPPAYNPNYPTNYTGYLPGS